MTDHETLDFIRDLYESFNRRDIDGWLSHFADDAEWLEVPTSATYIDWEGQRHVLANTEVPVPDSQCVSVVVRGGGSIVVAEFVGTGTNTGPIPTPDGELPPTGRSLRIQFCDIHEVEEGRIVRTHRYWDQLQFAEQLQG